MLGKCVGPVLMVERMSVTRASNKFVKPAGGAIVGVRVAGRIVKPGPCVGSVHFHDQSQDGQGVGELY